MDIIGLIGLIVAVVALAVPFTIEAFRRPRIEIMASQWSAPEFVPWTFATVRVRNKPIATPYIKRLLQRESAQGCQVELEYYYWDETAPYLRLPGRWSSVREPLRVVLPGDDEIGDPFYSTPVTGVGPPVSGGTASTFSIEPAIGTLSAGGAAVPSEPTGRARRPRDVRVIYDPTLDPGKIDVSVSSDGDEVAVAILRDSKAFAFTTESYKYPKWGNPDWQLELRKTYRVVVRVSGSGIRKEQAFKLAYLTNDVSQFRLQAID
jgi:hypothetical protein